MNELEYEIQDALDELPFGLHVTATIGVHFEIDTPKFRGTLDEEPHGVTFDILKVEIKDADLNARDGEYMGNILKHLSDSDRVDILRRFDTRHRGSDALYEEMLAVAGVET